MYLFFHQCSLAKGLFIPVRDTYFSICLMDIYSDLKVDMVEDEGTGTIMTMVS